MSKHLISMLTTVNAPYSKQLDGAGLAHCLANLELAKAYSGQVSSFLSEVPVEWQLEYAAAYDISSLDLAKFTSTFSKWTGETYKLAA
ncbi:hypothetical protein ABIB57_004859 [Devosia sp. UYZn731]|uniref:hypothetical protein n=1 Tax=Devosia sp. UYZn731 TaxID=3156345 RepID=UPI003395C5A0